MELFADGVNESGRMEDYLSAALEDVVVGSSGIWSEDVDAALKCGGVGNPPFKRHFLPGAAVRHLFGTMDKKFNCRTNCWWIPAFSLRAWPAISL